MATPVYFGTINNMQWIEAPSVDIGGSKQGYAARQGFLGGGAWVRRSKTAAKTYSFSWDSKTRDELQPWLNYADGIWGNGYLYYTNPMWMDRNVAPEWLAAPFKNYYDGPWVAGGVRPTLVNNNTSTNGYPVESAVYSITSTVTVPNVFIPIPNGYTAHVGAHGSVNSGAGSVRVIPQTTPIATGTPVDLTFLTAATATRTNATFSGDTNVGINITLRSASSGTLLLHGIIVQILPNGETPQAGGFVAGNGQGGMRFTDNPRVSEYSAAFDSISATAELVEVEPWEWQ